METERTETEGMLTEKHKDIYVFHSDAGHGWLQVARREIDALGIAEQITGYSYQYGGDVFLEEDQDATTFLHTKYGRDVCFRDLNIIEKYQDYSFIRSYDHYQP